MKISLCLAASLALVACSDPPKETQAPKPVPQPLTGRQAFQYTYPAARTWAADCQPLIIRSFNLDRPKSDAGKAGAWEITYVSPATSKMRIYTWAAVKVSESIPEGVFANHEESWSGPHGVERPFSTAAIRIDTPEALQTAIEKSHEYLSKPGTKPQINFVLESTSRFPDPAWRVFWGQTVSSAEWSVFVDASVGNYLGR